MHGFITLSDATSYDKICFIIWRRCYSVDNVISYMLSDELFFQSKINGENYSKITTFIFIVCKKRRFYEFLAKSLAQKV